jgi:hypothetical protein
VGGRRWLRSGQERIEEKSLVGPDNEKLQAAGPSFLFWKSGAFEVRGTPRRCASWFGRPATKPLTLLRSEGWGTRQMFDYATYPDLAASLW